MRKGGRAAVELSEQSVVVQTRTGDVSRCAQRAPKTRVRARSVEYDRCPTTPSGRDRTSAAVRILCGHRTLGSRQRQQEKLRVLGQAKRLSREVASGVKKSSDVRKQAAMDGLRKELDTMAPRVKLLVYNDSQRN